jgi:hypothetical protein
VLTEWAKLWQERLPRHAPGRLANDVHPSRDVNVELVAPPEEEGAGRILNGEDRHAAPAQVGRGLGERSVDVDLAEPLGPGFRECALGCRLALDDKRETLDPLARRRRQCDRQGRHAAQSRGGGAPQDYRSPHRTAPLPPSSPLATKTVPRANDAGKPPCRVSATATPPRCRRDREARPPSRSCAHLLRASSRDSHHFACRSQFGSKHDR